jgi:hypothetical protein
MHCWCLQIRHTGSIHSGVLCYACYTDRHPNNNDQPSGEWKAKTIAASVQLSRIIARVGNVLQFALMLAAVWWAFFLGVILLLWGAS